MKQKLKTHKGAKKRFKITATGKILRTKGMKSHNRRKKAPRVKRMFDRMLPLDNANEKQVKKLLPYGA
ncbi:MAG TPA: 50S ribosomal protein L35 [Thermomicrobiales bacterium]|nr:50S ribosomal protein L35 [Thermomicrobiales bacterium]